METIPQPVDVGNFRGKLAHIWIDVFGVLNALLRRNESRVDRGHVRMCVKYCLGVACKCVYVYLYVCMYVYMLIAVMCACV